MKTLTKQYASECLGYDPHTGIITWRTRPRDHFVSDAAHKIWNTQHAGKPAGSYDAKGYLRIKLLRKDFKAHRLIFLLMNGALPDGEVDHINRTKDDNRWCNLREVTSGENAKNLSMLRNNTSGVHGVSRGGRDNNWWVAHIAVNKKRIRLGAYRTIEEAKQARQEANVKYGFSPTHGESR